VARQQPYVDELVDVPLLANLSAAALARLAERMERR